MPNRIIFTSKTKVGIEAGKIPTSVDILVQTDNSPNMDDFRNWASDTNALISLNRTLQNEGIGNTNSGAQYFNRYGSANLYQTKLIPTTDYAGRTVSAQGDNRSWIRKDYIENYKITARGALNKSKTIFTVNLSGVQQPEKLYTILVPTAGGRATEPPQSNVLGNPPQMPGVFDGSITRKLTTSTGNTAGSTSITVSSIYGNAVASYGVYVGGSVLGTGVPPETYVGSSYVTGTAIIPLVDIDGNAVALTADCINEILYIEIPDNIIPPGVPHFNTPTNGAGATFAVYYNEDAVIEEIIVVNPGDNYSISNQSTTNKLVIPGSLVGGDDGENDVTLTSYNLNTYAILITDTDFQEKSVNLQDVINSEETGIDTFTYAGTAAGTVSKTATMVKEQTFITVNNSSLIVKGMKVTSSTGFGIPQNTYVADNYVPGSITVPLSTSNGITPVKVTITYATAIAVTFEYAATFTNISGTNITGAGSGATFIITKNINNTYNVFLTSVGFSYTSGTQIRINGSVIGGVSGTNDLTITVQKVLDKFPPNTRVSFFERSKFNPGYYELYLSSLPRTGVSYSKIISATGNLSGNNFITVTNASNISAGQQISGLDSTAVNNLPFVANNYISGSTTVPLTEADGTTEVTLTADANNFPVTFSSPVIIDNGDGLVFYRSTNSFWSQLNSGSIFEGRPTNYIAWYRSTKLQTRNIPVTLLPPTNTNNKYRLYTQRFRVDASTNLKTAVSLGSDWSLYIQVGKNADPKWETAVIISIDTKSTYTLNGKTRYIFEIVTQYPSKYSWDLSTEEISYCYVYKNILGGIFSDYIPQTVPYNKAYLNSEYVWKAPTTINIPISNTATTTEGGIFKLNSINESITGSTPVFRIVDKDTFSMYVRTWRDILPQTYNGALTSNQIKIISTASDPRYLYMNPRSVQFRAIVNGNVYLNVDTGNINLGNSPQTNSDVNYTNNVFRLNTFFSFAPANPGVWTYSFGRQYLYYQDYAWNFFSDNLTASTFTGNPSSLSVPYKFISTVPYFHGATVSATGSSNPIIIALDAHNLQAGDPILFDSGAFGISSGSINSRGTRSGTTYFVSPNNLTANSFEIVTTRTGTTSLTSSSGSITTPAITTRGITAALQTTNVSITDQQTSGIQLCGLHGLVVRGSYKIQAGTTEPIQLQDQYYFYKREFVNRESTDGEPKTITSIVRTSGSTIVNVTTSISHRMSVGDRVVITTTDSTLNSTESSPAIVTAVPSGTQFRYTTVGLTSAVTLSAGTAQPRTGWKRYLKINNEIIAFDYYTVDGNNRYTLYGVERGQLGTTAQVHPLGSDISVALDTWSPAGTRISNSLFNTNGTLKSNIAISLQNNWTYTREFPDYGGDNGLLYHGVGRRDAFQPSRWEVALFGPGYFAPGALSFVTVPSTTDDTRTSGRYVNVSGTASAFGASATFTITIGLVVTMTAASYSSTVTPNQIILDDATGVVIGQKIQSSLSGIPANTTVTNVSGNTITLSANITVSQTSPTLYFFDATGRTVLATVNSAGNSQYKIGETITINASSIGGTGSNLVLTASYLNFGSLYDGMDYAQPGIGKRLNKNPYYQALYKESSEVKYYQEPTEVGQRSYEDVFGAFTQAMVKTKNIISGIPDDTTPYYNVRTSSDSILLQASRDQYFAYLSGLIKRPKYLTTATTPNTNTIVVNDATGIEVGDSVYGPGILSDGAVIKSITGPSYFTLAYRGGVIKLGDGTYKKTSGSWSWNSDVYSLTGYTTNVVASAKAGETTSYIMFGLNTDPLSNSSYASIDYAWYPAGNGRLYIYENGGYIGDYGLFYTTTDLKIEYNGTQVIYYKDGVAQRSVNRSVGLPLYFDSSFYNVNGSLKNVFFGEIGSSSTSKIATIQLRQRRNIIKNIDVTSYINTSGIAQGGYEYPVSDASLGLVARISIPNSYGINQSLVPNIATGPFKYYISEIKFEYVDPIYQSQFKTFFFEGDKYSCPILKTEIDNNSGNLFLYVKNPILLNLETKEKYDSKLYSLRSKIDIVVFEDYKLDADVTRIGVSLSTTSKQVNVGSVTGIKLGTVVTTFASGGFTNYTGTLPANTTVQSIINDTTILLNNFPSDSGLASLLFTSNATYPIGSQYIFDPSPNLNKNSRYTLDTARPTYFTSKWIPGQTELDLFFSPDVNDPSNSINYAINIDDPVRYYAVDSGDRFIYKISTVSLNSGSSYLSRTTTDQSFANLVVGQKVYFTNIPAGVSLTENTPYYITYVLNNDLRISTSSGGLPLDLTSGVTLTNLSLRMRTVYNTTVNRNVLRTSLSYFDYQVQTNVTEVPSGSPFTATVATNGGTLNNGQVVSQTVSGTAKTSYSGITSSPVTGTATTNATFNVTKSGSSYSATLANGGSGYSGVTQVKILGTDLGGSTPSNDLTINVTVTTGAVTAVGAVSGTALTIYSGLSVDNISGSGSGATFNVTVSGTTYSVSRVDSGSGYVAGNQVKILGTSLGGATTTNDLTITITSASTGASNLLVTNGIGIESGMYVVSNITGIPALALVGNSYVPGSTTVPLRDASGNPIVLTANMSGQQIIFTKASLKVYSYNNASFDTYPYIGVAYVPSAIGYPAEVVGLNTQVPSASFQDQIQFTFANNTLPQEFYPYAKIEVTWPTLILSQNISVNNTTIAVNGSIPDSYPQFGNIKIGAERIYYGYRTSTYFGDCVIKFPHTSGDVITHSPNYTIKTDGLLHNGCTQNNQTKLIVMSATPSTGVGYSGTLSQIVYVAGFEMDQDPTNSISFPSTARYTVLSDKINSSIEVTVNRTGNAITLPANAIKTGQTLVDGDEIILVSSFGLGSGYKMVQQLSSSKILINKPTISNTTNTSNVPEYRRLFTVDSDIISGMNDAFIDTAVNFNSKRGLKYVALSGCTDFKPVKCTKTKYATSESNKYSNTITLADDISATSYTLTGLNNYYSSGSTKASGVRSVLFFDGEDYEIKSISGRVVTLVQPLKQKIRFRDAVTVKSDGYIPEFERVANVKGLVYGPQKAIFYDRYRGAQVSVQSLGYNGSVNRFRWRLTFTRGVPTGLALGDKISSNLNYNDYFITALPSSSELGFTTTATQIIVSSGTTIFPDRNNFNQNVNQSIIYISKPNGYVARDFETASMQIGGYKNASRQQIVSTQVLSEATDGAIADIEAVSTRATRDIFTTSLGEVLGRFLFKSKNFASSNRPNLWRNVITPPAGMNVKTGKLLSYLINGIPNYITFQSATNSKLFYGDTATWSAYTATGITINDIGLDAANSRLLFACSSNTIRYSSYSTPTTLNTTTITGSGTNTYITYVNGYYFVGNSTGALYYSTSVAGTFYSITTGNNSPVVGVYYDEFKYIVTHERISGSGTVYKNYTIESLTGANMNISTPADKIKGITNLFSPKKTVSSTYGFGKILESGYSVFDGVSTYSSPVTEVYEYENFSDYTSDDISDDYVTAGLSFNFGQFIAFGVQTSSGRSFVKYSSNARLWSTINFESLISTDEEITGVIYGGYNTYIAIVWNPTTLSNKILVSTVNAISSTDLTLSDLSESGRYRKIEEAESVKLYKYKTTVTSQEGNLLLWNSSSSQLVWLKNLFGSPLKSNEFTDYKALAVENFVVYTKNSKLLPNFRSVNDSDGASRAVSIYSERLPLGSATITSAGNGYQFGTYTGVEILNGLTPDYGSNSNRATATVSVDDTGKIASVKIDTAGDYYATNTSLLLVNDSGSLDGSGGLTKLNSSRTVNKLDITFTLASQLSYTKTATWINNATSVTLSNTTGIIIQPGQEVTGSGIPIGTYVSNSYNTGSTTVPLVTATGSSVTLTPASSGTPTLTFKLNFITIPSAENVTGLVRGMTVTGGSLQTGTVILSNYFATENSGPVNIPISKAPASNFINQVLSFSVSGAQASISTTQTPLDSSTFSLNGFTNTQTGYCVLYKNSLNGIDFIGMFFNSSGVLVDCISNLKSNNLAHLVRTEMFGQAL